MPPAGGIRLRAIALIPLGRGIDPLDPPCAISIAPLNTGMTVFLLKLLLALAVGLLILALL
jgi:hypothetical protein